MFFVTVAFVPLFNYENFKYLTQGDVVRAAPKSRKHPNPVILILF